MSKQIFEKAVENIKAEYTDSTNLLSNAVNIFSNVVGHCKDETCDTEHFCRQCKECVEICETIDEFINT